MSAERPGRTGVGLAFAVTALAAGFGTVLATLMEHAALELYGAEMIASSPTARIMLALAGTLLIGTTVVVGAIVARQALTGAIEDRRGEIALRRLLGASAGAERRRLLGDFVRVGIAGAVVGWAAGVPIAMGSEAVLAQLPDALDMTGRSPIELAALVPMVAVALAAVVAARLASRAVLAVTPLEALRGAEVDIETVGAPRRRVGAWIALGVGVVLLAAAVLLASLSPLAVVVGFAGGVVLAIGIVGIAPVVVPALVRPASALLGRSVPARVAAGTLATHPGRTAALVLALFVGVATVAMMATAGSSVTTAALTIERDPEFRAELAALMQGITAVITGIVGFSAVLGVLGFVATMLLSVRRRTREIGLLRTVGLRRGDTMRMLLAEAATVTVVAVATGLLVGVALGWVGAHAMTSSVVGVVSTTPTIPWQLPVGLLLGGLVVAVAASWPAGRRASTIPPLAAVAAE